MKITKIKELLPPSTIGIIGGGQLGRMVTFQAKRLGYRVVVLDPKEGAPAGQVADHQIVSSYGESSSLDRFADSVDVITYEFEHIDVEVLKRLEKQGHRVIPSAGTLEMIQNKYVQKSFLRKIGVEVPAFRKIENEGDIREFMSIYGDKIVIKSCRDGYDGKGNILLEKSEDRENVFKRFGNREIMAEEFIMFEKEVSVVMVRNSRETVVYPISENTHKDSILIKSYAPASISKEVEEKIRKIGCKILDEIDDYGVFCIEFFVDGNSNVMVNEIAPRPHNTGHYTIEGCASSQFEQLVRVVCGMPLGSPELRMPCVMYNILGDRELKGDYKVESLESAMEIDDCHIHLYGKEKTDSFKKLGHITAMGKSIKIADSKAKAAKGFLKTVSIGGKE